MKKVKIRLGRTDGFDTELFVTIGNEEVKYNDHYYESSDASAVARVLNKLNNEKLIDLEFFNKETQVWVNSCG